MVDINYEGTHRQLDVRQVMLDWLINVIGDWNAIISL